MKGNFRLYLQLFFIPEWDYTLELSRRMPNILMQMKYTVVNYDYGGYQRSQVCSAAWPIHFNRLWMKIFLQQLLVSSSSDQQWRWNKCRTITCIIIPTCLGIHIFWICLCIVSSEARGLVCILKVKNPSQLSACGSVKELFWVLYTLLAWIMLSYDLFQKLNKICMKIKFFVLLLIEGCFITSLLCWLENPS